MQLDLSILDQRILYLIILPTEQCNFRCLYCYEDYNLGRMKLPVVNGVKLLLERRVPELKFLQISWFGGEPLLALDIVNEISKHTQLLVRNKAPAFNYKGSITTNGYLLDINTFKSLLKLGITEFQISLDGDEDTHDRSRKLVNNKGTFKKIWENISAIHNSNIQAKILLRIHFSPHTYQHLPVLIERINYYLDNDSRFKIGFKAIEQLGGVNNNKIQTFSTEEEETKIRKWLCSYVKPENLFHPKYEDICYAAKANSFVIRANGDIGKCTVALNDGRNKIGVLNEDGSVDINNELFRLWLTGLETKDKKTLACPYNYLKKLKIQMNK